MQTLKPLFIHQYPDWTKFRYNADSITESLGKTRLQEGLLIGFAKLIDNETIVSNNIAQNIAANYAIDNCSVNVTQKDIQNFTDAYKNPTRAIDLNTILLWHAAIAQNKVKGFRTCESSVANFTGISPNRIPFEMERFIRWFETSTQDGAIKAAIAHFWFATIRPFENGNGRLARILSDLLLIRSENFHCAFILNEQILKNKNEYFKTLAKAQTGNGDITEWILWFLKIIKDSVQNSINNKIVALKKLRCMQMATYALTPHENSIVNAICYKTLPQVFSAKDVAIIIKASHDSALRAIQSLIKKGIAKAESKGGRSQKYTLLI